MGNETTSAAHRESDEQRTRERSDEAEREGFEADLRRLKEALTRLIAARKRNVQGLRSQGSVGLVARADATLPTRPASRIDDEAEEEDVTEKKRD